MWGDSEYLAKLVVPKYFSKISIIDCISYNDWENKSNLVAPPFPAVFMVGIGCAQSMTVQDGSKRMTPL